MTLTDRIRHEIEFSRSYVRSGGLRQDLGLETGYPLAHLIACAAHDVAPVLRHALVEASSQLPAARELARIHALYYAVEMLDHLDNGTRDISSWWDRHVSYSGQTGPVRNAVGSALFQLSTRTYRLWSDTHSEWRSRCGRRIARRAVERDAS